MNSSKKTNVARWILSSRHQRVRLLTTAGPVARYRSWPTPNIRHSHVPALQHILARAIHELEHELRRRKAARRIAERCQKRSKPTIPLTAKAPAEHAPEPLLEPERFTSLEVILFQEKLKENGANGVELFLISNTGRSISATLESKFLRN